MAENHLVAGMIGDVVASRHHVDQRALFDRVKAALGRINGDMNREGPFEGLALTTGDEFQGLFPTIEEALGVDLLLRLNLDGEIEVRTGIGWGSLSVRGSGEGYRGQSGSVWWNAREALSKVESLSSSIGWPSSLRTWVIGIESPMERTVNSNLMLRDEILYSMDNRTKKAVLGSLRGMTQNEIADDLGISQPSVSKRMKRGGHALARSVELLREGLR